MKILKFWRTELSYAQNKQRGEKKCLLGIDIYMSYSLNDIMEIRYIKCNRSEQVYEFNSFGMSCLVDNTSGARGTDLPPPLFSNFLFTNLFSIKFLYFFIISSLFPYFNLFVSIFIQSYVNIKLHVSTLYRY